MPPMRLPGLMARSAQAEERNGAAMLSLWISAPNSKSLGTEAAAVVVGIGTLLHKVGNPVWWCERWHLHPLPTRKLLCVCLLRNPTSLVAATTAMYTSVQSLRLLPLCAEQQDGLLNMKMKLL